MKIGKNGDLLQKHTYLQKSFEKLIINSFQRFDLVLFYITTKNELEYYFNLAKKSSKKLESFLCLIPNDFLHKQNNNAAFIESLNKNAIQLGFQVMNASPDNFREALINHILKPSSTPSSSCNII